MEKPKHVPELSVLNQWWGSAYENGRKKRWEWFVIDQFLRGNHDVRGNPNSNTIEIVRNTEKISYPINKIYATFRAVRGFVTRHKPFVQVEPKNNSESAKAYARRANALLERDNQLNNFRKINKEWVYYGVKYGLGFRQMGYDPIRQACIRWTVDPCDLYSGAGEGEHEDAPFLIKSVKRTVGYLKNKYKKTIDNVEFSPDNQEAADEYKRLSIQIAYGTQNAAALLPFDEQTKLVRECWYRVFEENKAGGLINKVTFVDEGIIDFDETPFTEYPFISYKSDIVPNESTGEGHLKHIISPQRMLNLLNSQLLEYNHLINKGRYLTDKNAGFSLITSQQGQIIQVNQGKRVTVLPPAPLNPALMQQLDLASEFIETIGGQHDASMGATPARVTSGDAIEALQMGDSNNISDLRDNFEDALMLEAQWILKMYSLFEDKGITLRNRIQDEEEEQFVVMGREALKTAKKNVGEKLFIEDNGDYLDVCKVLTDNQVKVSISSQLGETRQARLELLMRLVELGLPLRILLEHLEFPNVQDLLERIASEALAEQAAQQMAQPEQPQPGMPPPPPAPEQA